MAIKQIIIPSNLSDTHFDKGINTTNKIEYKLSYTVSSLRAGTNLPSTVYITDNNIQGLFKLDLTDTTSVDDGTYTIVDTTNKRWKRTSDIVNSKLQYVSSISALQAYTQSSLANFDGSVWEKKSGNIASNGGIYAGTIININTSFYWQRRVFDFFRPQYFGAIGNGIADDTVAIQNCLNASLLVNFGDINSNYKITGTLTLRTGHVLEGGNCTIQQVTTNTKIFHASFDNIIIKKINFVGFGAGDYSNSDSSLACAIYSRNCNGLSVENCTFNNFSYTSVSAFFVNNVVFEGNECIGIGSPTLIVSSMTTSRCYGVAIQGNNLKIINNKISQVSQGIIVGANCDQVTITDNQIFDVINQHGMYLQEGISNMVVSNNTIKNAGNIGIKLQENDSAGKDSYNITISNNITEYTGQEGILIINSTESASIYLLKNVIVNNNIIKNAGQSGISVRNVKKGIVSNNIITTTTEDGVAFNSCDNIIICGNNINDSGTNGIRFGVSCNYMNTILNTINNVGISGNIGESSGIFINAGSYHNIFKNDIYDFNSKMVYGILFAGGNQTTARIENNQISNSTNYGIRLINPVQTVKKFINNIFINCSGEVINGTQIWDGINNFENITSQTIISPSITGSTLTTTGLTLKSTTGIGTTGSNIDFLTGNNGSINALRVTPIGNIGVNVSNPASKVEVNYDGADLQPIAIFRNIHVNGFAGLQLDRSGVARYALHQYSTNGVVDWNVGTAYGNGGGNSAYSIGQTINSSDAKFTILTSGNIGINNPTPNASSILDIASTTKGVLIPKMTTAQRLAITGVDGLQVYDISLSKLFIHNGTNWGTIGALTGSYSSTGSATTTFTVTIGSTMPNIIYKVNVTPTAMLAAASFYVTNKTTTTFDVVYLTALTGAISFDYAVFRT